MNSSSVSVRKLIKNPSILQKYYSEIPKYTIKKKTKAQCKCTLIPGDKVGVESIVGIEKIFSTCNIPVKFEKLIFSETNPQSKPLNEVLASVLENRICIMGFVDSQYGEDVEVEPMKQVFRKQLDLYASVVRMIKLPHITTRFKGFDVVLIREMTEGEYSRLEYESKPGVTEAMKIMTAYNCQRIAKFAFDFALKYNRKKITVVHKANIMKFGDGLFLKICYNTAKLYPMIRCDDIIVDNVTMQIVRNPRMFDVLLMPNLYGSILSNIATGMMGGGGVTPSTWYSHDCAVFTPAAREEVRGDGKSENPIALLICAINMLYHLNWLDYGKWMVNSLADVLKNKDIRTRELGGKLTTMEFIDVVIERMNQSKKI